jgi:hypothetical protein
VVQSARFASKSAANRNRIIGWIDGAKNAQRNETTHYMKRKFGSILSSHGKKVACTVSAAALMLGVSSAATIGLHFQCDYYCSSSNLRYTGYPVTMTAFGIESNAWENLYEMPTGYHSCAFTAPGYFTNEVIDTETSTNGLNPLPNGSIGISWFGNAANFDPFYGYAGSPPNYTGGGPLTNPKTGEQQVYATFIRDGINFGPSAAAADNPLQAYYYIDITNLKTLFTNTPFVVELIASGDSIFDLTNAFVIDVDHSITNSVTYPATPPVANSGSAPWTRGNGGGLSTASGVLSNVDHIHIMSNTPQHGGTGSPPTGFDNAGTISGFIMTDKPVVSMAPQSVPLASLGDTVNLSFYAIGVPPLAYQWRLNGQNISGATATNYTVSNLTLASIGSYDVVVNNHYGAATSQVSSVGTGQIITQGPSSTNLVYDSNPDNLQHDGFNNGATWLASSTDSASVTRTGVMSFGTNTNSIIVPDTGAFDTNGTITFWMQSPGTDTNDGGFYGAAIVCRPVNGASGAEFAIVQLDSGDLEVFTPTLATVTSTLGVSDNKWHFVAVTFNTSASGGTGLFIDGAQNATNNSGGGWSAAGVELDIGAGSDNYFRPYNGLLNDVRYYGAVLSAAEITAIKNSGALEDPSDLQMQLEFAAPPQGGGLNLSWPQTSAVLQSAPTVIGPWVPASSSSPYTIIPTTSQQYFRYVYTNTPQIWISNPFLM